MIDERLQSHYTRDVSTDMGYAKEVLQLKRDLEALKEAQDALKEELFQFRILTEDLYSVTEDVRKLSDLERQVERYI